LRGRLGISWPTYSIFLRWSNAYLFFLPFCKCSICPFVHKEEINW
jgi:hypothetical protein